MLLLLVSYLVGSVDEFPASESCLVVVDSASCRSDSTWSLQQMHSGIPEQRCYQALLRVVQYSTHLTLASAGISCRHMSVCPSVTSRCST